MTSVAIVILNYNGEKLLPEFLPSVIRHAEGAQVVVADNASTDKSLDVLRNFQGVRVISLDRNYGFCGGYNRAIRQVQAEYIVLLNSDIEVTPNWLSPLVELLDRDPLIAAAQPKILSYRNKSFFEHAGAAGGFIDTLGYPFCRGRIFDHVEQDHRQYNDEREIFWSTGACMIVRKKIFEDLGGFDEYLFAHMEEIDVCWKIHRAGMKVFYTGRSTIYHLGAGTLGYESPFKVFLNFRNGLVLIYKHFNAVELFYKLPARIILDWAAALQFFLKGKLKLSGSVLKAHWTFIKDLRQHTAKRKEIHKMYPHYPTTGIYKGSIVIDFFLRNRKTIDV